MSTPSGTSVVDVPSWWGESNFVISPGRLKANKLRQIQFNGAFRNKELIEVCHNTFSPIEICFSSPHTHDSQGVAEFLVNAVKSLGRASATGGGSEYFRALA